MNDDFVLALPYSSLLMMRLRPKEKVVIIGEHICSRCQKLSYDARRLGDQWICPNCMKKESINDRWIYDYQQAFDEIDREFPRVSE